MFEGGKFLIVAVSNDAARAAARELPGAVTQRVRTFEEALDVVNGPGDFHAAFVDAGLLSGRELGRLRRLRTAQPLLPILLLAERPTPEVINGVQLLRVELLCLPAAGNQVAQFARRAMHSGRVSRPQMEEYLEELSHRKGLAERHVALVPYVLGEETAEQARERLQMDEDAFARALRGLLRKCRTRSAEGLAKNLMREALIFSNPFPVAASGANGIAAA